MMIKNFIMGILIVLFCVFLNCMIEPQKTKGKIVGTMKAPRICAAGISNNENLVIVGGYNSSPHNISDTVEVLNLKDATSKEIKSNFNNRYGNFLFDLPENKVANLQALKFNKQDKYGLEIIDLKTGSTKLLDIGMTSRDPETVPSVHKSEYPYCNDENVLYLAGGKRYDNKSAIFGVEYYNLNKNIKGNQYPNSKDIKGISDCYLIDKNKIYRKSDNKNVGEIQNVNSNISTYELLPVFLSPNFYAERDQLVIIDKENKQKPIQVYWYDPYDKVFFEKPFKLPAKINGSELKNAFKINDFSLRLVFAKGKDTYIVGMKSSTDKVSLVTHFKTKCSNPSFVYSEYSDNRHKNKIYAIGGLLLEDEDFKCGNTITNNKVCNIIEEFSF